MSQLKKKKKEKKNQKNLTTTYSEAVQQSVL